MLSLRRCASLWARLGERESLHFAISLEGMFWRAWERKQEEDAVCREPDVFGLEALELEARAVKLWTRSRGLVDIAEELNGTLTMLLCW
jgi:hypothetical protein